MAHKVIIYTDGACKGNPGPGGYGIVLISGTHRKEVSQGFKLTTNNRMELLAVIVGLNKLKSNNCDVTIFTDSKYVAESVEKGWVFDWEKNRFKKKKNSDLWVQFLEIYRKHKVRINWIKGHNNNPENERCDFLAVKAIGEENLLIDKGYNKEPGGSFKAYE